MNTTERDENQDKKYVSGGEPEETNPDSSADKLPGAPASDDDSELGDTDQHAD